MIYSAYRSNALLCNRFIKVFEEDSVLIVLQKYYDFVEDKLKNNAPIIYTKEFFGVDIYGEGWSSAISAKSLVRPNDINAVKKAFEKYWQTSDVEGDSHCLEIYLDDSDFCWYIFDEKYMNQYPEKTLMYSKYATNLPKEINEGSVFVSKRKLNKILPHGTNEGKLYMVFVCVYDYGQMTDLTGGAVLEGVRLNSFLKWLCANDPEIEDWNYNLQIKQIAKIAKRNNKEAFENIIKYYITKPVTELNSEYTADEFLRNTLSGLKKVTGIEKSTSYFDSGENIMEIVINCYNNKNRKYYDYIVLFDDLWANSHPQLAENLLRFASGKNL